MSGRGRVLAIAGSDSGGGAGIQADIKTITALGGYAATAITAITVQNTQGVSDIHLLSPELIAAQMSAVLGDIGADAIKTGMLGDAATIEAIADRIEEEAEALPFVLDPVMMAKGGAPLLPESAQDVLCRRLLPLASLITPNVPELARLTGHAIDDTDGLARAARILARESGASVLAKGGHLPGAEVVDILIDHGEELRLSVTRIATRHSHGTGCTLASAVATGLAQGLSLHDAVRRARDYLQRALMRAPGFGKGHGPLDHGHTMTRF